MRKPSKVVPIDSVKRKVIKHKALSTPEEEVTSISCIAGVVRTGLISSSVPSARPGSCALAQHSSNKSSSITRQQCSEVGRGVKSGSSNSEQE